MTNKQPEEERMTLFQGIVFYGIAMIALLFNERFWQNLFALPIVALMFIAFVLAAPCWVPIAVILWALKIPPEKFKM